LLDTALQFEQINQFEKATEIREKISEKISFEKDRDRYAENEAHLGFDYYELSRKNNNEQNLLIAIERFNNSLRVYSTVRNPEEFVNVNYRMGLSFQDLAVIRNKKYNLEKSIAAFNSSMLVINEKKSPTTYVMIQTSLGNSYRDLRFVENLDDNTRKALDCYRNALNYTSFDTDRIQYAFLQSNYALLVSGYDEELKANNEALRVYTPENYPIEFYRIQMNIANLKFIHDMNNITNLEDIIRTEENLQLKITPENSLIDYSQLQNNLGCAYMVLGSKKNKNENFIKAKKSLENALNARKPDMFPYEYAETQMSIGIMYAELGDVKNNQTNRQLAEYAFQEAFFIYTPQQYPNDNLRLQSNYDKFKNSLL
jgi:tetratricopeptide (TPR) repeat protein